MHLFVLASAASIGLAANVVGLMLMGVGGVAMLVATLGPVLCEVLGAIPNRKRAGARRWRATSRYARGPPGRSRLRIWLPPRVPSLNGARHTFRCRCLARGALFLTSFERGIR